MSKNNTQSQTAGSLRSPALTPKLRFPGFDGVWEEKKLDKVLKVIDGDRGSNYPSSGDFYPEGYCLFLNAKNVTKNGFAFDEVSFVTKEKDSQLRKGKLERNDIVLTTRGSVGHIAHYNNEILFENIRINSGMVLLRDEKKETDSNFVFRFLDSKKIQNRIQRIAFGSAQPQLTVKEINNLKISFPSLPEQQKIASFLGSVDEWVANLRAQYAELAQYKKGMMQKIFSQQIRFKDDKGNDFPDWEEKRLGEILKERKEYSIKGEGFPHISLTTEGVVPKSERYNRDFLVGDDEIKKYKVTRTNDLCYNPANLKFGVISINKLGDGIFSPIYVTFEVIKQDINFIGYYLIRDEFIAKARRYEQGTVYERMAVHPDDFLRLRLLIPSFPEQQKIAEFLSSVDQLLESKQQQITEAENWKKGLMQQGLFV